MVERHTGIPTTYNFQRFRSRIEARWAAFFDKMNWPWEYEPIDLAGYIPEASEYTGEQREKETHDNGRA